MSLFLLFQRQATPTTYDTPAALETESSEQQVLQLRHASPHLHVHDWDLFSNNRRRVLSFLPHHLHHHTLALPVIPPTFATQPPKNQPDLVMQKCTLLLAGLAGLSCAQDIIRGFNSGGIGPNGVKSQQDFEAEFNKMKNLPGTSGFTSARLFTTIQANTANDPTLAIPAAISTKTSLLLGLWASAGQDAFNQELTALRRAVDQYGE